MISAVKVEPTSYLEGEIAVPGDKVAAVHASLATALLQEETRLHNPHYCGDVVRIYDWIESKGLATVNRQADMVRIEPNPAPEVVDLSDLSDTRSNICLVTPLALNGSIVRFKGTTGCRFTSRRTDKHFELMEAFGLSMMVHNDITEISRGKTEKPVDFNCEQMSESRASALPATH